MPAAEEIYCYNPGCQQKFNPEKNTSESCVYHPGPHFFHDAYKGWQCCNKKTTDFTEFLNIKGCAKGYHNPNKPPEPEKPKKSEKSDEVYVQEARKPVQPLVSAERAGENEHMVPIKLTPTAQLLAAVEKKAQEKKQQDSSVSGSQHGNAAVQAGTSCQNSGCKSVYLDESSLDEECEYHPGVPIFHEGLKYWSCCKKKTTEFDNFLDQAGCFKGKHAWTKQAAGKTEIACKHDWHQTPSHITIAIYAKGTLPELSVIEVNRVHFRALIECDFGDHRFELEIPLWGAISIENTTASATPNKVEIKMRKADPVAWPRIEYREGS